MQGMLGVEIIMVMVIVPAVNDAFDGRMLWALFIVVTILEPMTGAGEGEGNLPPDATPCALPPDATPRPPPQPPTPVAP